MPSIYRLAPKSMYMKQVIFHEGVLRSVDFLTKKLDYLAISGDVQPRSDAQIIVVPMELVTTVHIPDTYKKHTIRADWDGFIGCGGCASFLP
jgi:hypothetical protein